MSKTGIQVTNGAVNLPTGFKLDVQTMRVHEHQAGTDVTSYPAIGGTPTTYGVTRFTGTPMQDISVTGYPFKGAPGGSNPFLGLMTVANGADLGTTATFQFDTGITVTGTYGVEDGVLDHSRIVAGARTTLAMRNTSDLVVSWA